MPLDEIGAGLISVIGRFLLYIFAEIILDLLIKGPGYFITHYLLFPKDKHIDPDGMVVIIVGIVFWLLVAGIIYLLYLMIQY